ncbi:MAG TPA: glycosyltransferase family 4 protein [Pyrinomonadaceae bacterium]|nr:glycosyltransferase family 4 protein [Pyrinomonadaceae bacterium]
MTDNNSVASQAEQNPRLWVVSELYYPELTSTGYYLTKIAEGLTDTFEVMALCGQPNYSARGTRASKREVRNRVEIFRVSGTTLNKNVIAFRLVNMLTLSLSMFFVSLRKFRKGDRVLVVTNPPASPFVIAIASLIRGAAYTLLIHDNYPEILIAAGKAGDKSLTVRFLGFWNRWLYKHAARIIAVGRDMQELLSRKTQGLDIPISVIPNWAELENVEPRPRAENPLLNELGILDRFVLLYAGNMGYPNDIETILSAAKELDREAGSRFHFVFLGSGVKRKLIERFIADEKPANLTLLEPRPREEQAVFLNACDAGIVSLVSKMKGVSMPSRTYNILAAGKPIVAITEEGSEVDLVTKDDNVGVCSTPGDVTGLLNALEKLADDPTALSAMRERARHAALGRYSLEAALSAYRRALVG